VTVWSESWARGRWVGPVNRSGGTVSDLPEVMASAVYRRPGQLVVEERPVPRPGPGQVLVAVDHCGICGSDIHLLLDGWAGKPGLVAGHEFTGAIAALGDGVEGWAIGEKVVGGASPRCGGCRRCLEGKPSQCENRQGSVVDGHDGAFAGFVLTSEQSLLRLPPGLDSRQAALAEPLAVALHGITRSGVAPGDSVMVIGAGPIGALSIAALVARGIGPITAVEPGERRQQLARDLGADEVVEPADLEIFPAWEPERIAERAAHVVLECSGHKEAMQAGFNQLRRGGTLALVGAGVEHPSFDPNRFILNELNVVGSFVYDQGGFEAALELLARDGFPTDKLIEADDVPLDGLSDALAGLAAGRFAGKIMVVPRLSEGATLAPSTAGDN
jgi:threonine dehydrogenase-like Zn-dependent dehydrogenase